MARATRDELKKVIDELPQSILDKLLIFVRGILGSRPEKKPLQTYNFGGRFDRADIRASAYD